MPATGRSCRQSVRHSVRLSDPRRRRRRRRLLSPDARGPPSAARSSRGPARRRAPPPPGPALPCLPVCPSVRPPALPSSCRATGPPARVPAAPALSLPSSLSLCLCPRARPLPRSGFSGPLSQRSSPLSQPRVLAPQFFGTPLLEPLGPLLQNTLHSPRPPLSSPHILLDPCAPDSWGLPPPSPYFPRGFPLLRGLQYLPEPPTSLSGFLVPPVPSQLPNFRSSLPFQICPLWLSLLLLVLRAPHFSGPGPPPCSPCLSSVHLSVVSLLSFWR